MKKSLIALLVVLALVVSVSVISVSANNGATTTTPVYASNLTVNGDTATGYCPHCDQNVTWTAWNGTSHRRTNDSNGNGNQQHLFLKADVSNGGAFLLADKANTFIVLHLNGKTLTNTRTQDGPLQAFSSTGTVAVLTNTAGEGGITCTGGAPINGNNKGNLIIYGGNYSTTRNGVDGGIINSDVISNGGSVATSQRITIYGGNFTMPSDKVPTNGGLFYMNKGTLTIEGGTFTGTASTLGGAIYANNSSTTVTMNGGTITGCSAPDGGAIYVQYLATVNLDGGTIENCYTTTGKGGAVYKAGSGVLNIGGATISGCRAGTAKLDANWGGAIYVAGAGLTTMNDGLIKDCYSYGRAGGIGIAGGSNFTIEGGTIQNCYLTSDAYQTFGGNIYNEGTLKITGGTITKGNVPSSKTVTAKADVSGGNICSRGGSITISGKNTQISGGKGKFGGNLFVDRGTHTYTDATISDGYVSHYGGNIYVNNHATTAINITMKNVTISGTNGQAHNGAAIYADASLGTINLEGCTIKDGKIGSMGGNICLNKGTMNIWNTQISGGRPANATVTTSGGNIYVADGTLNIGNDATKTNPTKASTISKGDANLGGNIYVAGGTVNIDGVKISDGTSKSHGGNIYLAAAANIENCEITGGVAGQKNVDEETGNMIAPTVVGRGGNIAVVACAPTLTDCVITGGESYDSNGAGGNIYFNGNLGGDGAVIDGCTITDGYGYAGGGNIQHHAAGTVTITGKSYISGGEAKAAGSNIYVGTQAAAVLKVEGDTEINATDCNVVGNNGVNIHVATGQSLYLGGNARIVSGETLQSIALGGAGKVYLSGNVFMDKYIALYASSHDVAATGSVTVQEGFTGDVLLLTYFKNVGSNGVYHTMENKAVGDAVVNFGAEAPAYLKAGAGYANTGTIKVHSKGRSGYVTVYNVETNKFTIAPYTAFIPLNNNAKQIESSHVEVGLANFDTLPANTGYVKLYSGTALTLNENLNGMPIDLNNQVVTINTNGYTLAPIDYRTDGGVVAAKTKLTVEGDESKVQLLVKNPLSGYNYLNVKNEETGTWTSNCVRVEMKQVSLRPYTACTNETEHAGAKCCGIYYTAKIRANSIATAYLTNYGIIAGLADAAGITKDWDANFAAGFRWTKNELNPNTDLYNDGDGVLFNSGLIADIMSTANLENASVRGKTPIGAKAYITAIIGGEEVTIFSNEEANSSVMDLADKLAEMYADSKDDSIKKFLNSDFNTAMREWTEATNLQKFYGLA